MTRPERLLLAAVITAITWAAYDTGHAQGYATGSLDTQTRWSSITDRCIAKLESTLVIARNR